MKARNGLVLLISLLVAVSGYAGVVVNFDGATANASTTANAMSTYTAGTLTSGQSQTYTKAYSTTTPLISSGSPNYSGQAIYGGSYMRLTNGMSSNYTVTATSILLYGGNLTPETIKFQPYVSNIQIGREGNAALMFAATGAGNYGFAESSTLATKMNQSVSGGGQTNRWLVVAGGVTYVSQSTIGLSTNMATLTLDNPDEINWAAWTPGTDMSFGSLTFDVAGSALTNITLVGVAINVSLLGGVGNRIYSMEDFSADLTVIPEGQSTTSGTPYSWLDQYGLTNYVVDDVLDQDADGQKTWQEYIAGTDPTNTASIFKAAQAVRDVVTWEPVVTGRVYLVYWSTNLVQGFTNLSGNIMHPQGSYTNTLPDDKVNHYLIKVQLP